MTKIRAKAWSLAATCGVAAAAVVGVSATAGAAGPASSATSIDKLPPEIAAVIYAPTRSGPVETFVAAVPGTKSYLAVVNRGGKVDAYICDSAAVASWLTGSLTGTKLTAVNKRGDVQLRGTRSGKTLTATLKLNGSSKSVKLSAVSAPSGVYEAVSANTTGYIRAGWVVLPDGSQRGNRLVNGQVQPVAALNPANLTVDVGGLAPAVAVPANVTTFSATVAVGGTTAPPVNTGKSLCTKLQETFNFFKAAYDDESNKDKPNEDNLKAYGNAFSDAYRQGKEHSCTWANPAAFQ